MGTIYIFNNKRVSFWFECVLIVFDILADITTHVKMSQLVTSLQTRRQQDVFALHRTSCQEVVPNLLATCNKLDENIRLVTSCSNNSDTILL